MYMRWRGKMVDQKRCTLSASPALNKRNSCAFVNARANLSAGAVCTGAPICVLLLEEFSPLGMRFIATLVLGQSSHRNQFAAGTRLGRWPIIGPADFDHGPRQWKRWASAPGRLTIAPVMSVSGLPVSQRQPLHRKPRGLKGCNQGDKPCQQSDQLVASWRPVSTRVRRVCERLSWHASFTAGLA